MTEINWQAEALHFCKENDIHPQKILLQHIEMAMQRGALLVIDQQIQSVKKRVAKVKRIELDYRTYANIRHARH